MARLLEAAADLMEVLGESSFRARAYRRAAQSLERYPDDLDELAKRGFSGLTGVGAGISAALQEIYTTGKLSYLEELRAQLPPDLLALFGIEGLGPKRIRALYQAGITSLVDLETQARAGAIRELAGFGAKSEENLLEAVQAVLAWRGRVRLPEGLARADLIRADLEHFGLPTYLAGSLRRGLETAGSLDFVVIGAPETVAQALGIYYRETIPGTIPLVQGDFQGLGIKVFCSSAHNLGSNLIQITGSAEFVASLGMFSEAADEEEIFASLRLPYYPPYFREPEHIGLIPPARPLTQSDLKGILHVHSLYSDGVNSIAELAQAAIESGYSYLGICDHSQSASYAGGMTPARVLEQWQEIDRLNSELAPFLILKGIESDILATGELDYPDEILAGFDFVIASLHSRFHLTEAEQTQRMLRALENPHLTIWGHPSARLLLSRKPVALDWPTVLAKAAEQGVAVELNCNPARLDLDWRLALAWREKLRFSLGPDAHSINGFADLDYGLLMANKAGLSGVQLLNTHDPQALLHKKLIS